MNCVFVRRRGHGGKPIPLIDLFSDISFTAYDGRGYSSTGYVVLDWSAVQSNQLYYILSFCNGYLGVWKVKNGIPQSNPVLWSSTTDGGIYVETSNNTITGVYYNDTGYKTGADHTSSTAGASKEYTAMLFLVTFPGYKESDIDASFKKSTVTRFWGNNTSAGSSSASAYRTSDKTNDVYLSTTDNGNSAGTTFGFDAWKVSGDTYEYITGVGRQYAAGVTVVSGLNYLAHRSNSGLTAGTHRGSLIGLKL